MEFLLGRFCGPMLTQFWENSCNGAVILSILAPTGITRLSISTIGGLCFANSRLANVRSTPLGWPFRASFARTYAVALAQGRGFVTDQYDGTVSVFDLASLAPVKRVTVGDYPEGIMATADAQRIIVANWESNTLSII